LRPNNCSARIDDKVYEVIMELFKNKTSDKYFIYIDETGNEEALFVTPDAKIKR
jgi:hypothetical protein